MSRTATTSILDIFLHEAYKQFNVHWEEKEYEKDGKRGLFQYNQYYIDVPVRLSRERMVSYDMPDGGSYELTNALIFLTGNDSPYTVPFNNQAYADDPSVSFIVGQYGMGKTELVSQVCHHLEGSDIQPLPINLGLCHQQVGLISKESPSGEEFATLLFGRILERVQAGPSFVKDELLPQIRQGGIMLLLDGLDELISTRVQHRNFFRGLRSFLKDGMGDEDELLSKVVVSMRLEYLSSFAPSSGAFELVTDINPGGSRDPEIPVYFLVIDYLGDSHIDSYLSARLGSKSALKELKNYGRVLDMLRRPLLLKLFCDLAGSKGLEFYRILNELKKNENPARLIESIVENVSDNPDPKQNQESLTDFTWDNDLLAETSLEIYRSGRGPKMTVGDIKDFLKPTQRPRDPEVIRNLEAGVVLKSIHKCPFLRHEKISATEDAEHVVHFAHRIFFEYFTARAIARELKFPNPEATNRRIRAFDELVLNVDMRKFLRGLIPEEVWFEETKKAYGLKDEVEWERHYSAKHFNFLNHRRKILLMSMTDPESPPPGKKADDWFRDIKETVEWFLDEEEKCLRSESWLHPRYLIYNYEAVAVYLWYHRWEADTRKTSKRFEIILSQRLQKTMSEVRDSDTRLQKPYELLLERILHIGQMLRYPWAKEFNDTVRQQELLSYIDSGDEDLVNRIEDIFKDIKNSIF